MTRRAIFGWLVMLLAPGAWGGQAPAPATPEQPDPAAVIATVNGEPIHLEDLERLLGDMHKEAAEGARRAPDLERVVFRLVNDKLLAQEARALELQREEPIPTRLAARRQRLAVEGLEREQIWSRAAPSDEEIERAFRDEYRRVSFLILTARERAEAERLLAELKQDADFAALARQHSIDPYAARGGRVENVARIDIPHELAADVFAMEAGGLKGPFLTRLGWSAIRVESFAEADPARRDALSDSLRDMLRFRKAEKLREELAARLRASHPVRIDAAALAAIVPERLPDGRLAPKLGSPGAVVAWVGDRTLTAEQLATALGGRWKGVANQAAAQAATPLVLERLIQEELLRLEAAARGYADAPEARRALSAYETQLLVSQFLKQVVSPGVKVTQEEMRRHYEKHREEFRRPPRLQLGQITVASEAEAQRLAGLLKQGTDLAWLARQHSIDRLREQGGDRGWVTPSPQGGPLDAALFGARPGDVLGPLPGDGGFTVTRVAAREEQGTFEFGEVSGNIRQILEKQESTQAIHRLVETARSRSEIVIHQDVIASLRISGAPAPEPGMGKRRRQ